MMDDVLREKQLWRQFKQFGDVNARDELIGMYEALARSIARKYDRNNQGEDVLQVARLGLIKSVYRFDIKSGFAFSSFATPTIYGEVKRYFRDHTWLVRPPRNIQELRLKIIELETSYSAMHGKDMSVAEIAKALGITQEEVIEIKQASGGRYAVSIENPSGEGPTFYDSKFDSKDYFAESEARLDLVKLIRILSERDRLVVKLRFFEDMTQAQIAEIIGVTQMQVSRILRQALEKMRAVAVDGSLKPSQEGVGQMGRNKVGDNPKLHLRVMEVISNLGGCIDGQVVNVLHANTGLPAGIINQVVACMERDGLVIRTFNNDRTRIISLRKCCDAPVKQILGGREAKTPALSESVSGSTPQVGPSVIGKINPAVRELVDFLAEHGRVSSDGGQATKELARLMGLSYATVIQRLNRPEARKYIDRKVNGKRTFWYDLSEEGRRVSVAHIASDHVSGLVFDEELSANSSDDESLRTSFDPPTESEGQYPGRFDISRLSLELRRASTEIAELASIQERFERSKMDAKQAQAERDTAKEQLRTAQSDLERIRADLQEVLAERDTFRDELRLLQTRLAELPGLQ